MYVITKDFTFSAAHSLDLGPDHPCSRVHGHNYVVRVELAADQLDTCNMVFDYGDMARFAEWLDEHYDHTVLNDLVPNPTAEALAARFYEGATNLLPDAKVTAVGVSETAKCWAWYRP